MISLEAGAVALMLLEGLKFLLRRLILKDPEFEFPAGKLDVDEVPLDCAVRELEEETSLSGLYLEQLGGCNPL